MRTFEQYIRESYDFRLGGKKRRGFEGCSFSQLEVGDKFYFKYFDDGEWKGERELIVEAISQAKTTGKKPGSISFSKVDDVNAERYTLLLSKEEFDSNAFSTNIELSSHKKRIYVWSTELLSEDDAYEIAYNAEMKESVDFRLGGSKDRGAANIQKTFGDLKMNDTVFMLTYDKMSDEIVDSTEYPCKIIKKGNKLFLNFEEGVFYLDDDIDKSVMYMTYTDKDLYLLAAYDIDTDDPDVIEMIDFYLDNVDESVDFRLGGKANKGDYLHKKFEELEPGDSIYVYELTSDGKRIRTNIFDYKKRRRSSDNSSSYFFMGEWRNEKLKMSKSILLSRDCYERSAFHSYKTMVWSTYEMTDEELAEFVNNKDNEINH